MTRTAKHPGAFMAAEIGESPGAFLRAAGQSVVPPDLDMIRAFYTIARGSSDAAANILSYEFMRETGLPMTSLPPSVFSVGSGVRMDGAAAIVVSQSGGSEDLIRSAKGVRGQGGQVIAITNVPGNGVEAAATLCLPIGAGEEKAVPATKTVVGSLGAGMALLSALRPDYAVRASAALTRIKDAGPLDHPQAASLTAALLRARHVYVIGRDTGFGAAQEIALKIKETCALHAEAYSSSEVLHGPLQLATNPLLCLILDTQTQAVQSSLDTAQSRLGAAGAEVIRVRPSDIGLRDLTPVAAAAVLLCLIYPVILATAVALGHDPDAPETLAKVTQTR